MKTQAIYYREYQLFPFLQLHISRLSSASLVAGRLLHWLPRLAGLVIPLSMAYYALGVINDGGTLLQTATALVRQFIPVLLYAVILVFAWEWDGLGAFVFIALAVLGLTGEWAFSPPVDSHDYSVLFLTTGVLFFANCTCLSFLFRRR